MSFTPDTWVISDTHFGHKNILNFEAEKRPFKTIEEHNQSLVEKWNSVVKPNDLVIHLGDVAWGLKDLQLLGQCNGRKKLVKGNHDKFKAAQYLEYFEDLYGVYTLNDIVMTHIPIPPEDFRRWKVNLHGHYHSKPQRGEGYFCVSCEHVGLTPIHIEDAKRLAGDQPQYKHVTRDDTYIVLAYSICKITGDSLVTYQSMGMGGVWTQPVSRFNERFRRSQNEVK